VPSAWAGGPEQGFCPRPSRATRCPPLLLVSRLPWRAGAPPAPPPCPLKAAHILAASTTASRHVSCPSFIFSSSFFTACRALPTCRARGTGAGAQRVA
jgi:hypothetical protein